MDVNSFIKQIQLPVLNFLIAQTECSHKWEKYGWGYKCVKCEYYTGGYTELNKMIAAQIEGTQAAHSPNNRMPKRHSNKLS